MCNWTNCTGALKKCPPVDNGCCQGTWYTFGPVGQRPCTYCQQVFLPTLELQHPDSFHPPSLPPLVSHMLPSNRCRVHDSRIIGQLTSCMLHQAIIGVQWAVPLCGYQLFCCPYVPLPIIFAWWPVTEHLLLYQAWCCRALEMEICIC